MYMYGKRSKQLSFFIKDLLPKQNGITIRNIGETKKVNSFYLLNVKHLKNATLTSFINLTVMAVVGGYIAETKRPFRIRDSEH